MEASKYLSDLLKEALKMVEDEAEMLNLKPTEGRNLVPFELYSCNSVAIIKGIMQVVLFEKNFPALKNYYPSLDKSDKVAVPLPEMDLLDIQYLAIQGGSFNDSVQTPTLKTPYGEIILGLPDMFVAEFYRNLKATVTPAKTGDNVVKVDFNGKKH